jgi:hypothetical protein
LRHRTHIAALISVSWKWHTDTAQIKVAQPCRQHENVHLPASVVDVVLARDLEPRGGKHIGEAGAECGAAAVADVQWAGWIGGHEFNLDFF